MLGRRPWLIGVGAGVWWPGAPSALAPGSSQPGPGAYRIKPHRLPLGPAPAPESALGSAPGPGPTVEREVWVGLPHGAGQADVVRRPVLLLLDGQNMFDTALVKEGSPQRWQMEHAAAGLAPPLPLPLPLLVAVAHGREKRIDEYTPWRTVHRGQALGGGGAEHARWLAEQVLPWVHTRFATLGPVHTAVAGSSLAGLMALWLLLEHRAAVAAALVVSPSVWWSERRILAHLAEHGPTVAPPTRLWLDVGSAEGAATLADAQALQQAVARQGWPHHFEQFPGAAHHESAWAARAPAMLRYLYGP
jgi:predicted alpha/beta superfamily hydrolase